MKPVVPPQRIAWWRQTWVRLAVGFVFVTTLPLVVTAIYTTRRHLEVVRRVAAAAAGQRAAAAARGLEEALTTAGDDLLTVAEWPTLASYLETRGAAGPEADFWRQKLTVQLRTFLDLKPAYGSINYADESSRDRLRVERRGTSTFVVETPDAAPPGPWVEQAVQLLARQLVLHTEEVGEGLIVTLATRARSPSPGRRHLVWLDLPYRGLQAAGPDAVADAAGRSPGCVALFDSHGGLLFAVASAPPIPAGAGPASGWRQSVGEDGLLVSYAAVRVRGASSPEPWYLALYEPAEVLEAGVADFRVTFLGVLAVALFAAVLLGVWLARQFTQPVRKLYDAAWSIGQGHFDVGLDGTAPDELGALGRQVGRMAEQLREAHEDFERRLQHKTEQLIQAERLATIGRTAAAVAHEINNPSGIISLYAQMLNEKLSPDDPNAAKLRLIDAKAREISRIVIELRDYSRKPAPLKEWVLAQALFQDALDAAQIERQASACVHTEVHVEAGAERIWVDPHQMVRVLRNLIVNAHHAMGRGGTLRLTCATANGGVRIEVCDTGAGMSPEQLSQLFDPFYSTKRFGTGTGLGLAISKEIVERHGGQISAASRLGEGATITILLPGGESS